MSNKTCLCDTCDKKCEDHSKNNLLISQHANRISDVEKNIDLINYDSSNTEGRLNMFIWAVGLVFMLIVSVAFYGVLQLNDFKSIYTEDNKSSIEVISELSANIKITNSNMSNIKDDVDELKRIQRDTIYHKESYNNIFRTNSDTEDNK